MPPDAAPITVWLVEDDPLYRQALRAVLDGAADPATGGPREASSPGQAVRVTAAFDAFEPALDALGEAIAAGTRPDVLVSDIGLPGLVGTEGARRAKALAPEVQIVMLTIHEDEDRLFDALCAGASGYLLKSASAEQVRRAVREVHAGGVPFTAPIARKVLRHFQRPAAPADPGPPEAPGPERDAAALTDREREVLRLLAEGHTQPRIAAALFLSPHTVSTHLRHIYEKLHVHTGAAAVSKALRERLLG
jgi:DNA-binding NarL/FixJ family response regulator